MDIYRSHVLICAGSGCTSSGSDNVAGAFDRLLKEEGLEKEVKIVRTGCFGLCEMGPVVIVYPEGAFYSRVNEEDVEEIVKEHLLKGRIVKRLLYKESLDKDQIKSLDQVDFYKKQMRVALRNCGVIDPENIDEYIAMDGYKALAKVLTEMTPEQVNSRKNFAISTMQLSSSITIIPPEPIMEPICTRVSNSMGISICSAGMHPPEGPPV